MVYKIKIKYMYINKHHCLTVHLYLCKVIQDKIKLPTCGQKKAKIIEHACPATAMNYLEWNKQLSFSTLLVVPGASHLLRSHSGVNIMQSEFCMSMCSVLRHMWDWSLVLLGFEHQGNLIHTCQINHFVKYKCLSSINSKPWNKFHSSGSICFFKLNHTLYVEVWVVLICLLVSLWWSSQ